MLLLLPKCSDSLKSFLKKPNQTLIMRGLLVNVLYLALLTPCATQLSNMPSCAVRSRVFPCLIWGPGLIILLTQLACFEFQNSTCPATDEEYICHDAAPNIQAQDCILTSCTVKEALSTYCRSRSAQTPYHILKTI